MDDHKLKELIEYIYHLYHHRKYVYPDPVEFLYEYHSLRDREIVGFIAASLAYGRVKQIHKSVRSVLSPMGSSPYCFLKSADDETIETTYAFFKHRFATAKDITSLLCGIRDVINAYGSLYDCFLKGLNPNDNTVFSGIQFLSKQIIGNRNPRHLVTQPDRGSACKRINLFLRWMVREDEIDPGGWSNVSPSKLIVPLDTHLHSISRCLGLTSRKQSNMHTALEITIALKKFDFHDPVRYDFSLTRIGIQPELHPTISELFKPISNPSK